MAPTNQPRIGITIGDAGGIGPEVVAKTLRDPFLPKGARFQVLGNAQAKPGRSTIHTARQAWQALETAVKLWKAGEIDAVVTGPVQKETLARAGFLYTGQTEFFAARCRKQADDAVMVMHDKKLTVSLCSTHSSLRDAIKSLTSRQIVHVGRVTETFMRNLGVKKPRIAVAGLNPHAGENGLFGTEEKKIILPAVRQLTRLGIKASGPHSPDTVFYRAMKGGFDAVICMYHDQGLIPFKLLAFTTGVNVTLGLPIIRTSPDHGTGLDIAGKNRADHSSMLAAVQLAVKLVRLRN
jgi:4-hydroxythreonine-4-phosphate dehydrogenase